MGDRVDLDRLYKRNAPVPFGGKVERAIQFNRFCGSLYRDLRLSYPEATWDQSLAADVQGLVLRARNALELPPWTFLTGGEEPHAFWSESNCVLESCAAVRTAQRGAHHCPTSSRGISAERQNTLSPRFRTSHRVSSACSIARSIDAEPAPSG